ncbi:acyl-CoA dehydrogenase family protein [Alloalcanivorax mobilis]|uniref:acyl-CoA dehydrogenase family protein n=1 Tax=Alloalcanivorax mobilis TaxID=2019569 RepID=UPI0018E4C151|nr:acyl-CoA dehydrogenase family protein [Alloalcanivorax mobilis]
MAFFFNEPPLDDHLEMIRQQIRRFVEEVVVPHGEAWELEGLIPRQIFKQMGDLGFLGISTPEAYGGSGLPVTAAVMFAEELSRSTFGGFASSVTVHTDMSLSHIVKRGSEAQKQRYLPDACAGNRIGAICVTEPDAGSDVAALRTRATRDGDDWIINGAKMFITNGVQGDVYIVAARTDPNGGGSRGLSMFIVERDTPGFTVARKLDKHGWRCSDTAELYFDDVRIPSGNMIGEEGKGFYYIVDTFQHERLLVGGLCAGQCSKAIELTLDYVKTRKAFGKTLWEQQAVRQKLSDLTARAAAARALTYQCARMIENGQNVIAEVSMLKAYAAETLQEVVHGCLQLHGGTGYMTGTPIERMVRDARVLTIGGGATEVMLEEVAKRL